MALRSLEACSRFFLRRGSGPSGGKLRALFLAFLSALQTPGKVNFETAPRRAALAHGEVRTSGDLLEAFAGNDLISLTFRFPLGQC